MDNAHRYLLGYGFMGLPDSWGYYVSYCMDTRDYDLVWASMMDNGNTPANPVSGADNIPFNTSQGWPGNLTTGLTKREAFAMAAMQGLVGNEYLMKDAYKTDSFGEFSTIAVAFADNLLAELDK